MFPVENAFPAGALLWHCFGAENSFLCIAVRQFTAFGEYMRLDKYLKVSRLIKRRTVANEVCDAKHVSVNGKVARASYDVKVGDMIEIQMGENRICAKVLAVNEHATKENASAMYEIVS